MNTLLLILLHGGLFAGAAGMLWLLPRRRSAARATAGARFIMLTALLLACGEAVLALKPLLPETVPDTSEATLPPLPRHPESGSAALLEAAAPAAASLTSPGPAATAGDAAAGWSLSPRSAALLASAWTCGAGLLLGRWLTGLLARRRLLKHAIAISDPAWIDLLRSFPSGKHTALWMHREAITPCTWGRVILLPAEAAAWPESRRRMVLAHECAHRQHYDSWWLSLSHCFLAFQWFNPMAWLLVHRCRISSERAADDAVLTHLSDAPAYAELLVDCARRRLRQPAVCSMASPSTVQHRVVSILDETADRRPAGHRWCALPAAFCLAAAAAVIAGTPPLVIAQELIPRAPEAPTPETPAPDNPGTPAPGPQESPPPDSPESPPPSKKRLPFAWTPQQIDGRDYVSALQVQRFYEFPRLVTEGDHLTLRSARLTLTLTKGESVIRINNVRFILLHPVLPLENTLWVSRRDLAWMLHPILKPTHLKDANAPATVIIDAGHGGEDIGAAGLLGRESAYTLDTARHLQRALESEGWKVVMTRTDDVFVPSTRRVEIANAHPDAVFVSIHFNAHTAGHQGLETFVLGAPLTDPEKLPEDEVVSLVTAGIALGTAVHANCLHRLRSTDGGLRGKPLEVLAGLTIPGILVEGGYLTHETESARIDKANYRTALADAIAGGLKNYRRALMARRGR